MLQSFTFELYRYYNGSWERFYTIPYLNASLKREQISRLKAAGYKYERSLRGYVCSSENGLSSKIAYFKKNYEK